MFDQYPKTRPPLPEPIAREYLVLYRANREGGTIGSAASTFVEQWMHRQVGDDLRANPGPAATLEIGAGTLNHLSHEPVAAPYDVIEPFRDLYAGSPQLSRVRAAYADIREIPLSSRYDRIIAIASFEHICNLPAVVARAGRLLADGGTLRIAIPSEGGPAFWLGWRLTTGLEFWLRKGLDYGRVMRHEHVNTAREVEEALRYFFKDVDMRLLGATRRLSLYQFFACRGPRLDRCAEWDR